MKPEHFIYKSDSLYYMQNMPDIGELYCDCKMCRDKNVENYHKAIERAKAEAIPFNDYFLGLKRILHSMNISCGEGNEELVRIAKLHLKEGQVYTINMEEKIEIYDMELKSCEYCQNCKLIPTCTTLAARIAAPKKEEGSEKFITIGIKSEHTHIVGESASYRTYFRIDHQTFYVCERDERAEAEFYVTSLIKAFQRLGLRTQTEV